MWSELPDDLEMYMRLYYFNVTNSEEIKNREPGDPGPKPVLEEIGDYCKIFFKILNQYKNLIFKIFSQKKYFFQVLMFGERDIIKM